MIHYIKLLSDCVDFLGYSHSRYWIGYFERDKDFDIHIANEIISFFCENFCTPLTEIVIATSYYIDNDNISINDSFIQNIENDLSSKGYIKRINGNSYFSEDDNVFDKQLFELDTCFQIYKNFDNNILSDLSLLLMMDSNVQGQCFFILEKDNLIIYPHGDNTGYGCIGINNRDSKKGYKFLYEASKKRYLNSYLYLEDKVVPFYPH